MPENKTELWLDRLIWLLIAISALAVPLAFSRQTSENFILPKEYVVHIASAICLAVFALKWMANGFRLTTSFLHGPFLALFGWIFLSLTWNFNRECGIRDMAGHALIALFSLYLMNSCATSRRMKGLFIVILLGGMIISVMNICEANLWYFCFDPVQGKLEYASPQLFAPGPKGYLVCQVQNIATTSYYFPFEPQNFSDYQARGATFGNKNFVSIYSALMLFIALGWAVKAASFVQCLILYGCTLTFLYVVLISGDLAAMLGLFAGAGYLLFALWFVDSQNTWYWKHRFKLALFVWLAIAGCSYGYVNDSFRVFSGLKTFLFSTDFKNFSRFTDWYSTSYNLRTLAPKALWGEGHASLKHLIPLYQSKSFSEETREQQDPGIARYAHNDILQMIAELGLIGFALILWFLSRCLLAPLQFIRQATGAEPLTVKKGLQGFFPDLWKGVRFCCFDGWKELACIAGNKEANPTGQEENALVPQELRMSESHWLLMGLNAGIVCLFASSTTEFPFCLPSSLLMMAFMVGGVAILGDTRFFSKPPDTVIPETPSEKKLFRWVLIPCIFITALLSVRLDWRAWTADNLVRQADSLSQMNPLRMAPLVKDKLLEALKNDALPGSTWLKMSFALANLGQANDALYAADRAWKNINFKPLSYSYHSVSFAKMHMAYALFRNPKKTVEFALEGLSLTCGFDRAIFYSYLIAALVELRMVKEAELYFPKLLTAPYAASARDLVYKSGVSLASLLASMGNWEKVYSLCLRLSQFQPNDPVLLNAMGSACTFMGQLASGEALLRQSLAIQPASAFAQRDLGINLAKAGRVDEAMAILEPLLKSRSLPLPLLNEIASFVMDVRSKTLKSVSEVLK